MAEKTVTKKTMSNRQRRDAGLAYISDDSILEEQLVCRKILQKLNFMDRSDFDGISETVKELFGKSENAFVNPPFYCDYGKHIEVGKNFFANYNCTLLDVAKIRIGDNCQMAPNVAIYTAGHPVHPVSRNSAYEYGKEVTVGDNVWFGVVTKDIPDWCIAAGNPCKVIRRITDEDKKKLFRNEEIDDEAWADIAERMTF